MNNSADATSPDDTKDNVVLHSRDNLNLNKSTVSQNSKASDTSELKSEDKKVVEHNVDPYKGEFTNPTTSELLKHEDVKAPIVFENICLNCRSYFISSDLQLTHSCARFYCSLCESKFAYIYELSKHYLSHFDYIPTPCKKYKAALGTVKKDLDCIGDEGVKLKHQCRYCSARFKRFADVLRHKLSCKKRIRKVCSVCGKSIHPRNKTNICLKCRHKDEGVGESVTPSSVSESDASSSYAASIVEEEDEDLSIIGTILNKLPDQYSCVAVKDGDAYKCIKCLRSLENEKLVAGHYSMCDHNTSSLNSKRIVFICAICYFVCDSLPPFKQHRQFCKLLPEDERHTTSAYVNYSDVEFNFVCRKCNYKCQSMYTFQEHVCQIKPADIKPISFSIPKLPGFITENGLPSFFCFDCSPFQCFYNHPTYLKHREECHPSSSLNHHTESRSSCAVATQTTSSFAFPDIASSSNSDMPEETTPMPPIKREQNDYESLNPLAFFTTVYNNK